ncbi:hypothetical protein PHMEG_00015037 [Phytophthora megakarya]|uniref:HTH psq-type domain-containing protein n=1 Tax=Phytophthora megakarya TaxID=4795 RepID=A0A225W4V2_9STRA|nr:hypothetical protein PHMEG_00015037 [Phytophthora megakarya]
MAPQCSYSIRLKREAIALATKTNCKAAGEKLNIPRGTLCDWIDNKENNEEYSGTQTSKTLKGKGAKPEITFVHDIITFMKDYLYTGLVIQYMKGQQPQWFEHYLSSKATPEKDLSALMRLCQRFAAQ